MNSFVTSSLLVLLAVVALASARGGIEKPKAGDASISLDKLCVSLTDSRPCWEFPDGQFDICDACHLGFFAKCRNRGIMIMNCDVVENGNGGFERLVFDSVEGKCVKRSTSCRTL